MHPYEKKRFGKRNGLTLLFRKAKKLFPERQFYYRCNGHIRFFVFSPKKQYYILLLLSLSLIFAFSYITYISYKTFTVLSYQEKTQKIVNRYRNLLTEAKAKRNEALQTIQKNQNAFLAEKKQFETRMSYLEEIVKRTAEDIQLPSRSEDTDPNLSSLPVMAQNEAEHTLLFRRQNDLLEEIENIIQAKIKNSHHIIQATGLNTEYILNQNMHKERGTGGPFITMSQGQMNLDTLSDPVLSRAKRVLDRLQESKNIQSILTSIPLASPVKEKIKLASGYGRRKDPFTGKYAFHNGLDFRASWRSPVLATAPGKIIYAGWRTGYGKVIEIDHGHHFRTRYAHLSKIFVQKGSQVAVGQKIGSIGSTGRSTGPHLHYEVRFKNRTYNPKKFLEAKKHARK